MGMGAAAVAAIEALLTYRFSDRTLLEEALTHPSSASSPCYERLEFLGDATLGCAFSNILYLEYPNLDPGQLSKIKAANICTEKLARVAVKHGLYPYIRHCPPPLAQEVGEFVKVVRQEDGLTIHGGSMKAPKVLSDVVEALAAAVYIDLEFDMQRFWTVFGPLLEPIVTLEDMKQQPQPVSMLFEVCEKQGKLVEIRHQRSASEYIATVYVDNQFVASYASELWEFAKLSAAKEALKKLSEGTVSVREEAKRPFDPSKAKAILHDLCGKEKWPKPEYKIETEGSPHDEKYECSVTIKATNSVMCMKGDRRSKRKDAERSATLLMLNCLRDSGYL